MARGVDKPTVGAINTQLQGTNQLNQQMLDQNKALQSGILSGYQNLGSQYQGLGAGYGGVLGQYQNMVANPGYDTATKNAITNASQGAAGTAFASAGDALARRAARTNNSSGMVAGLDQLGRDKAAAMGGIADQNQIQFANQAKSDVQTGLKGEESALEGQGKALAGQGGALQGQSGLYGVDTNLLARTMGIPPELLGTLTNATKSRPGFWETLGNSFAGALGGKVAGDLQGQNPYF